MSQGGPCDVAPKPASWEALLTPARILIVATVTAVLALVAALVVGGLTLAVQAVWGAVL